MYPRRYLERLALVVLHATYPMAVNSHLVGPDCVSVVVYAIDG